MVFVVTKELRELARAIEAGKAEARKLLNEGKLDEAEAKTNEVRDLQRKFSIMQVTEEEEREEEEREGMPLAPPAPAQPITDERRMELLERYLRFRATPEEIRELKRGHEVRDLNTGVPGDGGVLIPDNYMAEIVKSIEVVNSVRQLVRVTPVSLPTGTAPKRITEAGRLNNLDEYGEIQKTASPQYGSIKYSLHKYGDYMPVSREMIEDPVFDILEEVREWFADLARNTENYQVFYGSGISDPLGILNSSDYTTVAAGADITISALRKFALKIGKGYWKTSKWIMNTDAFLVLQDIVDGEGRSILHEDPKNDFEYRLLGRPVEIWDEIETKAGKTHILFGDFQKGYRMFARKPFELATSAEAGFLTDSTYIRGIERIDGQPWDTNAIRVLKDVVIPS